MENGKSREMNVCYLKAARLSGTRCQTKTLLQNFYGNQPPPAICCLPATCTQYRSRDSLMWVFSITLRSTAVGGINLLVWMHATLNGLAVVPRASSVSCAGIHLGFRVAPSSLPSAAEAISKLHHSLHQVTLRLDFHRRWAHYEFSSQTPNWLCNDLYKATL